MFLETYNTKYNYKKSETKYFKNLFDLTAFPNQLIAKSYFHVLAFQRYAPGNAETEDWTLSSNICTISTVYGLNSALKNFLNKQQVTSTLV